MEGRFVLVKCVAIGDAMQDMTIGNTYAGYLPVLGEEDKDGFEVRYEDEIWIYKDDAGDECVTTLSDGFEIVAE